MKARTRRTVHVHSLHQSSPSVHKDVKNTYQKGDMFCVMVDKGVVYKYPIAHLFRVTELP